MKKINARHKIIGLLGFLCFFTAIFARFPDRFPGGAVLMQKLRGKATVSDRVAEFGPLVRARWQPYFEQRNVGYPPQKVVLVGFKREKQLQVYASNAGQVPRLIRTVAIQGLSGRLGPKLRYGDFQVPEGFYRIESLNPNSAFHLALRVNYPNAFDRSQAQKEDRSELGGDIMIHGSNASIGCLAMGDEVAEDLFVLAAETGVENVEIILSPLDFREDSMSRDEKRPQWVNELYREISAAVRGLAPQ